MTATALAAREAPAVPQVHDASALMRIIEKATMDPNFDVAKLQALLAVRKEWEADEARKAFNAAFAAFKAEAVEIVKNKAVSDGPLKNKRYAELFSVVNGVTPALSRNGLSTSWRITKDEPTWIELGCTLRHILGHSETVTMGAPPDDGGAKNKVQARASTVTYLERYTLKAVCGIAEQGDDDDAAGATGKRLDDSAHADHLAAIDGASDAQGLRNAFGAAYKAAEAIGDAKAMRTFGERKESRKKALGVK